MIKSPISYYRLLKGNVKDYKSAIDVNTYLANSLEAAYLKLLNLGRTTLEVQINGKPEQVDIADDIKAIAELRLDGRLNKVDQ